MAGIAQCIKEYKDLITVVISSLGLIISIVMMYRSIASDKRAVKDVKEANEFTLREVRRNDLKYKNDNAPLLMMQIKSCNHIFKEYDFVQAGDPEDLGVSAYLNNYGKGIAKDIEIKVTSLFSGEEWKYYQEDYFTETEKMFVVPKYLLKDEKIIDVGEEARFISDKPREIKISIMSSGEKNILSDEVLTPSLRIFLYRYFYQNDTLKKPVDHLFLIETSYKDIYDEEFSTTQVIRTSPILSSVNNDKGTAIFTHQLQFDFKEEYLDYKSKYIEAIKTF